jgi:hypothetical protein
VRTPAHRSQSVFELAVISFGPVVGVLLDVVPVVPRGRGQFVGHGRVDRGGVGHHLARRHLQGGQHLAAHRLVAHFCPGARPVLDQGVYEYVLPVGQATSNVVPMAMPVIHWGTAS